MIRILHQVLENCTPNCWRNCARPKLARALHVCARKLPDDLTSCPSLFSRGILLPERSKTWLDEFVTFLHPDRVCFAYACDVFPCPSWLLAARVQVGCPIEFPSLSKFFKRCLSPDPALPDVFHCCSDVTELLTSSTKRFRVCLLLIYIYFYRSTHFA